MRSDIRMTTAFVRDAELRQKDLTFADRASAAAKAAQQTRQRAIDVAASAYLHDVALLRLKQPANWHVVSHREIAGLRTVHEACLAHLDELERLIAQRDGHDDAQSVGPDVGVSR
jgi:hypothetical protein